MRVEGSPRPPRSRPRVLVVDDTNANLLALEVQLEGLPCDVQLVRSGLEALTLLLRETFAVMLLDVRMPGMDGFEVARHARMHSNSRDLPIIFMTAESPTEDHLTLGYDSGAVDFLFKPVSREILRSKVRVFVELYESRHELAEANRRLELANAKLLELVDEQAAATSALRQTNDELGSAFRGLRAAVQGNAARPAEVTPEATEVLPPLTQREPPLRSGVQPRVEPEASESFPERSTA